MLDAVIININIAALEKLCWIKLYLVQYLILFKVSPSTNQHLHSHIFLSLALGALLHQISSSPDLFFTRLFLGCCHLEFSRSKHLNYYIIIIIIIIIIINLLHSASYILVLIGPVDCNTAENWCSIKISKFQFELPMVQSTPQKLGVRIGQSPNLGCEAPKIWGQSPNRRRSPRKSRGGGLVSPSPEIFLDFDLQIVQFGV